MNMLRRTFLLSVSVLAIAGVLPSQMQAAPPPIKSRDRTAKLELIERAIDAAKQLGFSSAEQMQLFGLDSYPFVQYCTYDVRAVLQDNVFEQPSIDVWNRMRYVIAIHEELAPDAYHLLDMKRDDSIYAYRQLMLHDQISLLHVARQFGSTVVGHGYKEMAAYC